MPIVNLKGLEIKRDLSKPLRKGEKRVVLLLKKNGFEYKFDGDTIWGGRDVKKCWQLLRQAYKLYKYKFLSDPETLKEVMKDG